MERLVVCQGTAQLVTAVAALRAHDQRSGAGLAASRDHLVICGLAVPEPQIEAFAQVIERMAAVLHPFASITRLDDLTLDRLTGSAMRGTGGSAIAGLWQQATGLGGMDEVFTVRNWQACNALALAAYPQATHISYGDSVGVYLPRGFMAATPTPWARALTALRRLLPRRRCPMDDPRVDINYLLLPDAFGRPPQGEVVRTETATLRGLFASLAPLLNGPELEAIRKKIAGRSVWVLLGSNFSEQGLMAPEAEACAYRDWIEGLRPAPGAVLLIKSHPRDHQGKRALLHKHLEGLFDEVWSADAVGSAYLPVEVLLLELTSIVGDLRCLTVSTACLGTRYVVGSQTDVGFGEAVATRYIAPGRRQQRLRHERDLRRLCVF